VEALKYNIFMSIRKTPLVVGEYYHIYNRGNSKQAIFLDDEDYRRFIKLLYLCNSKKRVNFREDIAEKKIDVFDYERGEPIISIGAWVLMPNHFHLYIISPKQGFGDEEKSTITEFMSKLGTSYSKYFNKKYNRTGKLFEDKFKTVHVDNDIHAKYLFSYIHLNPLKIVDPKWKEIGIKDKNKAVNFLNNYKFSSYKDFCGIARSENKIISTKDFPDYFSDITSFKEEIFDWILFSPKQGFGEY
jgi:putative transposase